MRRGIILLFSLSFLGAGAQQSTRLNDGWEFLRSDLGSVWEAVRPLSPGDPGTVPAWKPVHLPHCVNARDGVDPDVNYYQGPAWYRTRLQVHNPYSGGRTLLHFEGAGQATDVYVYTTKVGAHVGGYDEWTVDITDAVAAFEKDTAALRRFKGRVPVSIRCDNSRDVQRIPSSMSDFTVAGGIYRYLNLEYVPAVYIDNILVNAVLEPSLREGRLRVRAVLNQAPAEPVMVRLIDPTGRVVKTAVGDTTLLVYGEMTAVSTCRELDVSEPSSKVTMMASRPAL